MKIAIIGAKGMLGRTLHEALKTEHEILAWDIDEIDVTQRQRTIDLLSAEGPDLIINSAVFVNLEGCEAGPEKAWRINAVGAQNLALAARQAKSALLYISTDYIFDGDTDSDYDEVANPNPLNQYGRSKLAGERFSLQICPQTYIVRTAWLFGHAPGNYVERVLQAAEQNGRVQMPQDQLESPTYTVHLAEAVGQLIKTGAYGIYNITSLSACTRADFARFVLQAAGRTEPVEVVEPSTVNRIAQRPRRVVLDCRLFQLVTGQPLPHWQDGVRAYLETKNHKS